MALTLTNNAQRVPENLSTIDISNIVHGTTKHTLISFIFNPALLESGGVGNEIVSIAYGHSRSGAASIDLPHRLAVKFVKIISSNKYRDYSFRKSGLKAKLLVHNENHVETRHPSLWEFNDVNAATQTEQNKSNDKDLEQLFSKLPDSAMRASLWHLVKEMEASGNKLKEFYLAYGRKCEVVFTRSHGGRGNVIKRSDEFIDNEHLQDFWPLFEGLHETQRRTGIPNTLHRISRTIHAVTGEAIGVTARVGRTIQGQVSPMLGCIGEDALNQLTALVSRGLLIIGPPNVGKTTVLRELTRLLSLTDEQVVTVVDKSLEICGTDKVPHWAIGNARVLTVGSKTGQASVMVEAVENQSPDIVVVDELSTREECQAARTISGRGAIIIASVHGESLSQLLDDPERNLLLGSVTSVTLSAREAAARPDKLRQVQRRMATPVFGAAIELRGFGELVLHENVQSAVDAMLDLRPCPAVLHRHIEEEEDNLVKADPILGIRQNGNAFSYVRLPYGSSLPDDDDGVSVDFSAKSVHGQAMWTSISEATPNIWEPTTTR